MKRHLKITNPEEAKIIAGLNQRSDFKSLRIKKLLALPDLTQKANSPVKILFDRILELPRFKDADIVDFPRIVTVEENFDLLNTPADHPSRAETDTYYVDEGHVLRTQMTDMWSFYLKDKRVLQELAERGEALALSSGIVFRKDEIDRSHYPAFHQIDGLYVCKKSKKIITVKDLEEVQIDLAQGIFGKKIEYKFITDTFPFTDPSVEMDIKFNNDWLEVNGAGLVHPQVLKNFGLDPVFYNGWAFGFGDRLAMIKMEIPDIRILWSDDPRITSQFKGINSKFKPVSKYPAVIRDISFVVPKEGFDLNAYYELIREVVSEDLVEETKLLDKYEDEVKFGKDKTSYTFRVVYRSLERTLTNEEVNQVHGELYKQTAQRFNAELR